MRDTDYATELARASIDYPKGSQARMERLYVKGEGKEEIRFSWWMHNQLMPRPLDLPETDFLRLLEAAIANGVVSNEGVSRLRALVADNG